MLEVKDQVIDFANRYSRRKIVLPADEYHRRLGLIQQVTNDLLIQRDIEFGGTDYVEGVLILGSYAKSYPLFGDRIFVNRNSDLDIAPIASGIPKVEVEEYSWDNREAIWLRHPVIGFEIALGRSLRAAGLNMRIDAFWDLHIYESNDKLCQQLANDNSPESNLMNGVGLLIISPNSPFRARIIEVFKMSKLPVVIDPFIDAQLI